MADFQLRGETSWRLTVSLGTKPGGGKNRERKLITIEDPVLMQTAKKLAELDIKSAKRLEDFLSTKNNTNNTSLHKAAKKLFQYLNEEWLKFKIEVEAGAYIAPEKMKFADFVPEWREKYASDPNNLSPATLENYEMVISSRLLPAFGHMRIDQINAMQIVTFLKDLEKPGARKAINSKKPLTEKQKARQLEPLDAGTIGYIYRVLKNIFTRAVEWQLIPSNPMEGIAKPAPKNAREKLLQQRANPQYYDEREAQLVVDALYKESRKWRLLILGSMIGGCRRGELNGLEWPYVNFDDGAITIENNIPLTIKTDENTKGKAVEKDPKSLASNRVIDMPEWYMRELELYYDEWQRERERLKEKWSGGNRQFVFHNGTGEPYYYQHPSKWWSRFCKRHGIRYIKFHGLRHSMGTLLLEDEDESNFDSVLIAIQRRLGHSRLSTSADTYTHMTKKVKKRTAGKFDKFARGPEDNPGSVGVHLGSKNKLKRIK